MIFFKFFRSVIPSIAWTIIIFILLALPGSMLPKEEGFSIPNFDKIVHMALFGGFVMLWALYFTFRQKESPSLSSKFFILFVISCLYGTAMEFLQRCCVPNRDYDIYDIMADCLGALIAFICARYFLLKRKIKIQ